jgi:hypothetical protein
MFPALNKIQRLDFEKHSSRTSLKWVVSLRVNPVDPHMPFTGKNIGQKCKWALDISELGFPDTVEDGLPRPEERCGPLLENLPVDLAEAMVKSRGRIPSDSGVDNSDTGIDPNLGR